MKSNFEKQNYFDLQKHYFYHSFTLKPIPQPGKISTLLIHIVSEASSQESRTGTWNGRNEALVSIYVIYVTNSSIKDCIIGCSLKLVDILKMNFQFPLKRIKCNIVIPNFFPC